MRNKFTLQTFDENGDIASESKYTTYGNISKDTGMTYHDCRAINYINMDRMKRKFTHGNLNKLLSQYKILDI